MNIPAGTEVRIIGGTQTRIGLRGTVIDEKAIEKKNFGKIAVYIAAGKHSGKYWYHPHEIEAIVDSEPETLVAKGAAQYCSVKSLNFFPEKLLSRGAGGQGRN